MHELVPLDLADYDVSYLDSMDANGPGWYWRCMDGSWAGPFRARDEAIAAARLDLERKDEMPRMNTTTDDTLARA